MTGRLGFNLFLLAVAAGFVWSATGYEPAARRIPVMVGLIVLATPIVQLLFERGQFGPADTAATAAAVHMAHSGVSKL